MIIEKQTLKVSTPLGKPSKIMGHSFHVKGVYFSDENVKADFTKAKTISITPYELGIDLMVFIGFNIQHIHIRYDKLEG